MGTYSKFDHIFYYVLSDKTKFLGLYLCLASCFYVFLHVSASTTSMTYRDPTILITLFALLLSIIFLVEQLIIFVDLNISHLQHLEYRLVH
ncbi:hypothetical protein Zm00014a_001309 [Zea mays]|uniref:Uncharacterized protein n=1 Tax=Zea mays TaxID=4577 RepID=A0A3L6E7V0_MAIZE|nr:hypothetical protein Zm00014a_001309 [Zea mays]